MKATALPTQLKKRTKILPKKMRRLFFMLVASLLSLLGTSCVPLLIGGVVGYVAREDGIGVVEPISGQDTKYRYSTTPPEEYNNSEYSDYPVY